jgi:hypothetical protein
MTCCSRPAAWALDVVVGDDDGDGDGVVGGGGGGGATVDDGVGGAAVGISGSRTPAGVGPAHPHTRTPATTTASTGRDSARRDIDLTRHRS